MFFIIWTIDLELLYVTYKDHGKENYAGNLKAVKLDISLKLHQKKNHDKAYKKEDVKN